MSYLVEVENQVQFAHIPEVLVQDFHQHLKSLEHNELVIVLVDNCYEVQSRISFVDDFVLFVVQEIALPGFPGDHQLINLNRLRFPYTSLRNCCFSRWDMLSEYHLVSRERPCLLMRKKQWIILNLDSDERTNTNNQISRFHRLY